MKSVPYGTVAFWWQQFRAAPAWQRWFLIVLFGLTSFGLALRLAEFFETSGTSTTAVESAAVQVVADGQKEATAAFVRTRTGKAPETLGDEDISRDYEKNVVAADTRYKGKSFLIIAIVTKVSTDADENIYLELDSYPSHPEVRAYLADQHPKLSGSSTSGFSTASVISARDVAGSIDPPENVMLYCTGAGIVAFSPVLKRCYVDVTSPWRGR